MLTYKHANTHIPQPTGLHTDKRMSVFDLHDVAFGDEVALVDTGVLDFAVGVL